MTICSSFFKLFLLSASLASCLVLPAELKERRGEEGRKVEARIQDREPRSVSTLKVLDFSEDNDHQPDSNGEYTSATLEAGPLPESFTICSALMVEAWTTEFTTTELFELLDNDGNRWGRIELNSASSYTEYVHRVWPVFFCRTQWVPTYILFFPCPPSPSPSSPVT